MKIAFIQNKPECSLGNMYIASAIKGYAESKVFICDFEGNDLYSSVAQYKPDILAFSAFTGDHKKLLAINIEIKNLINVFSIFGGPHVTYSPDLIYCEGVDAICRGEGEEVMLELIKAFDKGNDYLGIQNFLFKTKDGEIIKNDIRSLNQHIDNYVTPDRSIYSHYFHIPEFKNNIAKRVITGRGCPFNCSYCYNHSLKKLYTQKGRYLRIRSVGNVLDEMRFLKEEYQVSDFDFVDDVFGINDKWLEDFSSQYREVINLPFSCLSHFEFLDERYIHNLKKAGCQLVNLGFETGDEAYRKKILKRRYSNLEVYEKTQLLHKNEISFSMLNILLLPGESLKMALKTLSVNIKCKPFDAWVAIYQPYPNTDLANYALSNKFLEKNFETVPDNLFQNSVLANPQKKILMRLFYLFSFTVKFRFFYPFTRIFIYLPFDWLYKRIYEQYKSEIRKRYLFILDDIEKRMSFKDILFNIFRLKRENNFLDISRIRSKNVPI